ncbi:hypothetical protein BDP67DRAFT_499318 [Colletotrichum lupini]|nr:hypothetical protein BDP67DRAFT_499318 [Colletotrichum lupini]
MLAEGGGQGDRTWGPKKGRGSLGVLLGGMHQKKAALAELEAQLHELLVGESEALLEDVRHLGRVDADLVFGRGILADGILLLRGSGVDVGCGRRGRGRAAVLLKVGDQEFLAAEGPVHGLLDPAGLGRVDLVLVEVEADAVADGAGVFVRALVPAWCAALLGVVLRAPRPAAGDHGLGRAGAGVRHGRGDGGGDGRGGGGGLRAGGGDGGEGGGAGQGEGARGGEEGLGGDHVVVVDVNNLELEKQMGTET